MRVNNDLGIFDFDDFAMEMTSTELLLVNGGACGGGFSGGSSSVSSSCGGSFNGGISQQYGVTYVLERAENVHGGQHWIVLEGYSINSNGQVQFDYNGTSKNDVGRNYILGTPTDEQRNQNFYSISKIKTYMIK